MRTILKTIATFALVCLAASAGEININNPFPAVGDAYCSATNGCGNITAGGQTAFQFTATDFVLSAVFTLPTNFVDDLTANWQFQDFLGNGNTETWFVLVNGIAVASATLPDDASNGDILTVTGTTNFAPIFSGTDQFQVELVLQNTVPLGGGSVAWLDGGITGLSYTAADTPEPGSLLLLGSGLVIAGFLRRRAARA